MTLNNQTRIYCEEVNINPLTFRLRNDRFNFELAKTYKLTITTEYASPENGI